MAPLNSLIAIQPIVYENGIARYNSLYASETGETTFDLSFPNAGMDRELVLTFVPGDGSRVVECLPNEYIKERTETGTIVRLTISQAHNFVVVVQYAGRWYLRNGTHRAVALLLRKVVQIPAIVVYDGRPADLRLQSGCFPLEVLRSQRPPLVRHFADERFFEWLDLPEIQRLIAVDPPSCVNRSA